MLINMRECLFACKRILNWNAIDSMLFRFDRVRALITPSQLPHTYVQNSGKKITILIRLFLESWH